MFMVYQAGSFELDARLKNNSGEPRKKFVSLKGMEHVKRTLENTVAQQSLKLESGLILLAIAVIWIIILTGFVPNIIRHFASARGPNGRVT